MTAQDGAIRRATTPTYADAPDKANWHDRRHEPFAEGNEAAVTHGARSPRKVEELANKIGADLLDRAPWVAEFPEELRALGRAEAIAQKLFMDIVSGGLYKNDTFKASQLSRLNAAENTANRIRSALGLNPASAASVARDRAAAVSMASGVDLQALANRGREALDARNNEVTKPDEEDN